MAGKAFCYLYGRKPRVDLPSILLEIFGHPNEGGSLVNLQIWFRILESLTRRKRVGGRRRLVLGLFLLLSEHLAILTAT